MARGTTEGCMSIDVRSWDREGRLRPGQCFLHHLTPFLSCPAFILTRERRTETAYRA
jgi:hypothetical protein